MRCFEEVMCQKAAQGTQVPRHGTRLRGFADESPSTRRHTEVGALWDFFDGSPHQEDPSHFTLDFLH